jgi:hypothetical protein
VAGAAAGGSKHIPTHSTRCAKVGRMAILGLVARPAARAGDREDRRFPSTEMDAAGRGAVARFSNSGAPRLGLGGGSRLQPQAAFQDSAFRLPG